MGVGSTSSLGFIGISSANGHCTASQHSAIPNIRNLAYFDSHTVFIKVCNIAHNFDCRRKKPPKFVPLKLEICLNYAYSLDLYCQTVIKLCEHQPVSTVCACVAKQWSWNFCVKFSQVLVTSTCENRPYSYVVVMNVSFCACAAQVSSYTTVLGRYKIVQSSLLTFTKHVGMVKDT